MAGKLHRYYSNYATSTYSAGSTMVAPQKKYGRAYAEGYNARRAGAAQGTNPHPIPTPVDTSSEFWTWDRGWSDAEAHVDPTHVGGPATFT
jgi:hypothetical protein